MTPKTITPIAAPSEAPPAARAALTALAKIHARRKVLEAEARSLKPSEVEQVAAAINAGASWDHIAAVVGQAQPNAHRAYAKSLDRTVSAKRPAPAKAAPRKRVGK